ncbi:hypothetical protein C8F04DRAFT_1111208 [Mycena alexandri]|uniref:DUF6533 domain-containing protein n=1 Tax=Mycena alexandri TaxID=1745969 RepID=A0AAD6SPB4_9AGAR|nr:hypothetical protein C8F04DRAFT_1111208 [Mycena alexandri]
MTPETINAAATHFLQFRLQYSSIALIYYDFALTFPKEVKYIWNEKFRLSTALYIGCRYALIANAPGCDRWYKIVGALSILGRAAVIVAFGMRTYVVWGENKWILTYMSFIGLACVALDITHVPGMRCVGSSTVPMLLAPEMLSILMVIFEASAAFLTMTRCLIAFRTGGFKAQRHDLMFILFEQGGSRVITLILLCSFVSIFTTAAVVLNYAGFFQRLPNAFTLPLSCTLTSRFILSLREWDAEQIGNKGRATNLSVSVTDFGAPSRISAIVAVDDFGGDPVAQATEIHERATELRAVERLAKMEASRFQDQSTIQAGPSRMFVSGLADIP